MIKDSIKKIITSESPFNEPFTAQIIELKRMQGDNIFMVISDGSNYIEAALNSSYISLVDQDLIKENQLILIEDYTTLVTEARPSINIVSIQPKQIIPRVGTPSPIKMVLKKQLEEYTPISALSTFLFDWTIKAKVVKKFNLTDYQNSKTKKTGKYFTIQLMDNENTHIPGTFFDAGADKFFSLIEIGKVYLFSNGKVTLANAKYRTAESNYQINFDSTAVIELASDQT